MTENQTARRFGQFCENIRKYGRDTRDGVLFRYRTQKNCYFSWEGIFLFTHTELVGIMVKVSGAKSRRMVVLTGRLPVTLQERQDWR